MALRTVSLLSIFVASPADVRPEREVLERVVHELNLTLASSRNARLELVRWETHSHPAISNDPQAAINMQLGSEHDIIVGIFWGRIGSPTPRAPSGSLEEIEQAISRWEADSRSVEVMIYFKDDGIPPSQSDSRQLAQLSQFRASLGQRGILYHQFTSSEFEQMARIHLSRVVNERLSHRTATNSQPQLAELSTHALVSIPGIAPNVDSDAGYEDLAEDAIAGMNQAAASIREIGALTLAATASIESRTAELNLAQYSDRRRILEDMAADLENYAGSLVRETNQIDGFQGRALSALAQSILMISEDNAMDVAQGNSLLLTIRESQSVYRAFSNTIEGVKSSFANSPRIIRQLNIARRNVVQALDLLSSKLESWLRMLSSIEDSLVNALSDRPTP